MSLIAPLNFLFAGLLGFIVLLYMLRLKRKERVVPSTLLWQSAMRDLQANAPWQKLRSSLLMWLQLAFLALAVLALVRPALKVLASGGQTIAIVIDGSASMKATDVSPSRFDKARAQANDLVNRLATGDMGTVIAAGVQTRVLAPLTADKNVLKRSVSRASAQDTGADLREAIVLAASLLRGKKNPQIYVLSDGAVTPLQDLNLGKIGLQYVKFGSRAENLAITAMDARRTFTAGENQAQVFATVTNFGTREKKVNLELAKDGDLLEVKPVTVPAPRKNGTGEMVPGQVSTLFDNLSYDAALYSTRIDSEDDLESDNIAYAQLEVQKKIRVLLATDDVFLERALNVDPNVRVFRGSADGGDFDVVVCEGSVPANLPVANQFIFNATTDLTPVTLVGEAQQPSVADVDPSHPILKYAPWSDLKFARSMAVTVKPWGKAVVDAERTPLIVAGERNGRRVIWCGFDTRDTDLPLRITFPIFISNSLRWLTAPRGSAGSVESAPLRVGQPVPLVVPATVREVTVTAPDRTNRKLPVEPNEDSVFFGGADEVGLYTAKAGNWSQKFAVSLLSKTESNIMPKDSLSVANQPVRAEGRARANRELWGIIIVVALGILTVEWWVFHRGV